ncbi:very long-chain acyl-CoA synthetase-like isoform X2 [Alosa alosa]|uniref:very long-chain acyl-CoA synthetase-like isoform X2 n=1 Tax=Alosa alosa TaxID=278164 RepID=UPI0020153FE7|nr:very long-chain acyl-CoA synthetase-like isoform X2 [Alosa alosa]
MELASYVNITARSMYVWLTILAGLAVLPAILKPFFPYFFQDLRYILKTIRFGIRLTKYKRGKPLYSILDCFLDAVKKHPNKIFIHFEGKSYTYLEVDKQSNKVANALRTYASLKEGDTVALFLGNEPCYAWTWLGLAKLGCPVALLNYNIRAKSLLHCFSCSGAKVLIAAAELRSAVEDVLPVLKEQGISVYLLSDEKGTTDGISCISEAISQAPETPIPRSLRANVGIRSIALYIYTSGTTGITVVLRRKFSASQFWEDCRKHDVTVMQYIGETLRYLCNTPQKDNEKNHKVRIAIGNGVRTDVWNEFLQRFGNIYVRELYAATEGNVGFINYTTKVGVVGRVNFLHKRIFPYSLIKFDADKEEPVRNAEGLCVKAAKGETGLLVGRITKHSPFVGYAGNKQQTEKKRLQDVFVKGDLYFNSGDLLKIDHHNFVYFQDRVGDTFRWKGENVATTEVADILSTVDCIDEANVYGVKVPGHEGRIGMAAITLQEGKEFDCVDTCRHVANYLPVYARPRFIRIQSCLEMTGTFKMKKVKLVEEGFDPGVIQDDLYFLHLEEKKYVPLTSQIYDSILAREIKL